MSYEAMTRYLQAHNEAVQNGDPLPDIDALPPAVAARVTRFLIQAGPKRVATDQRQNSKPAPAELGGIDAIGTENAAKLATFVATLVKSAEITGAEALK